MSKPPSPLSHLLAAAIVLLTVVVSHVTPTAVAGGTSGANPFTPKAYLIRYWNNKIYKVPRSTFLLSKASPLSAADAAAFASLAGTNALSAHLSSFCKSANLLCFADPAASLKHDDNVNFASYNFQNFTSYGTDRAGGKDSFQKYSPEENEPNSLAIISLIWPS